MTVKSGDAAKALNRQGRRGKRITIDYHHVASVKQPCPCIVRSLLCVRAFFYSADTGRSQRYSGRELRPANAIRSEVGCCSPAYCMASEKVAGIIELGGRRAELSMEAPQ
ncbi:hypothetical protein SRHO_G00046300 [Serrasalmus rhombeus]